LFIDGYKYFYFINIYRKISQTKEKILRRYFKKNLNKNKNNNQLKNRKNKLL